MALLKQRPKPPVEPPVEPPEVENPTLDPSPVETAESAPEESASGTAEAIVNAPAEQVDASELTESIAKGFPEPTDSPAGNAEGRTLPPPPDGPDRSTGSPAGSPPLIRSGPSTGPVDSKGTVFDPLKHAVEPNGTPKRNKHGRFYSAGTGKRKGTPPKKREADLTGNAPPSDSVRSPTGETLTGPPLPDRYDISAEAYCRTGYAVASVTFDDAGWNPESDLEHSIMKTAVADALRHWEAGDLTPPQRLAIQVIAYSGKRATRPNTKERLTLYWLKFRSAIGWKKKADLKREADAEAEETQEGEKEQ